MGISPRPTPWPRRARLKKAELRAGRTATAGRIEVYIHHDAKSGVMIELNCETDFVARNDEFKQLAKDLALHIMAVNPLYVRREDVPEDVVAEQKRIFLTQVADKPPQIQEKIAEGKLNAWYGESVLLDQIFVKDDTKSVRDVILAVNSRTGENISVVPGSPVRSSARIARIGPPAAARPASPLTGREVGQGLAAIRPAVAIPDGIAANRV